MATASVKGTNVTKFDAGGSGDNYIADGYIKSVEKVWMDDYTLTGNVVLTNTTISIAKLPVNKKITSVQVIINTSISQSNGTISLGWTSEADAAAWGLIKSAQTVTNALTTNTLTFPSQGNLASVVTLTTDQTTDNIAALQQVTAGTQTTIALKLNNWTMTTGTIKTIVRYT